MGFSTPSTGKACGASPLTLACARHGRTLHRTPLGCGCVGTLLSLLCLRRGVPIIILGQHGSDCIHASAIIGARAAPSTGIACGVSPSISLTLVFAVCGPSISPPRIELLAANSGSSYWGSRRPLHRRKPAEPPLHKKEETQSPDLTGYWIGSPAGMPGGRAAFRF